MVHTRTYPPACTLCISEYARVSCQARYLRPCIYVCILNLSFDSIHPVPYSISGLDTLHLAVWLDDQGPPQFHRIYCQPDIAPCLYDISATGQPRGLNFHYDSGVPSKIRAKPQLVIELSTERMLKPPAITYGEYHPTWGPVTSTIK